MTDLLAALRYLVEQRNHVWTLFVQHLQITGLALLLALLIAFPLGITLARYRWLAPPILGLLSILYTVPSLALLIILIPFLGLGVKTAVATLVIYAQVVLVRNIVVGLHSINPALLEAATAMGMNRWVRWWRVELPLALPIILAGVRIAAVTIIGIAAIAAKISAGGLGTLLFMGIQFDRNDMIWAGALVLGLLAFAVNAVVLWLERLFDRVPRRPQA